jgi:acyl dehydratase
VIEALSGRTFGPVAYRTCAEKVSEYVAATGDDPGRWREHAPPPLAGAALFVVAPQLIGELGGFSILHGEQTFAWHRAIPLDVELSVGGSVNRVRERGGTHYVGFELTVERDGEPVLEGSSLFVVPPPGTVGEAAEEEEPPAPLMAGFDAATSAPLPGPDQPLPPLLRSASRADLVRYAGASRDWNPIHWDHAAARAAGLPGVVVHGLLQSAWLCQAAARHVPGPHPLASARFRYVAPLRPGEPATITGTAREGGRIQLGLGGPRGPATSAAMELRR